MGRRRATAYLLAVAAILFLAALSYKILREEDPYRYYTGLGDRLSFSQDDKSLVFSYFHDGKEAVYVANADGQHVRKVTKHIQEAGMPAFAPTGNGLLCLGTNEAKAQTQSLYYTTNVEEPELNQLTRPYLNVYNAVFAPDGETIYFLARPVDDGIMPAEITEGADLYAIQTDGSGLQRLTRGEVIPTGGLTVAADGKEVYYSGFDESEVLYVYDVGQRTIRPAFEKNEDAQYDPVLSPDGKQLAYTAFTKSAGKEGLLQYELFVRDLASGREVQLTTEGKHITAPVFFNGSNRLAYLLQTNWPNEPAQFQIKSVTVTGKDVQQMSLAMPKTKADFHIDALLDRIIGMPLLASLYGISFLLWVICLNKQRKRIFIPTVISLCFTLLAFGWDVATEYYDPWFGLGIQPADRILAVLTVIILFFTLIWRNVRRKKQYEPDIAKLG